MTLPELLGTVPQWITASLMATIVIAYWRRGVALKELANADAADVRDHLAKEIAAVREESRVQEKHTRELLEASDRRHQECEDARVEDRKEITAVHLEIEGLKLQLKRYSADNLMILDARPPSERAPEATKAAERVRKIVDDRENGK